MIPENLWPDRSVCLAFMVKGKRFIGRTLTIDLVKLSYIWTLRSGGGQNPSPNMETSLTSYKLKHVRPLGS